MLTPERANEVELNAERARASFGDRVIWHVNATAQGGGVAEMLQTLLAYGVGARIENRWLVLDGDAEFFTITKRLHNLLHGDPGDGGGLGEAEHDHYRKVLASNLESLLSRVSPLDIVVLHDPQTAGLVDGLRDKAVRVAWRCHVGRDTPNDGRDLDESTTCRVVGTGGPIAAALLNELQHGEKELWCIGSHAHGALWEMLLHSLSEQLVRTSHVPVVLVGPHVTSAPSGHVMAVALDGTEGENHPPGDG